MLLRSRHCAALRSPEQAVLADLYSSTRGAAWSNNSGWAAGATCFSYGVACDSSGGLTALRLSANGLAGTFPTTLCNATDLQLLDLSSNLILARLPSLAGCTRLHTALLSSNLFTGSISPVLGQLPSMTRLDLSRLHLKGDVPPTFGVNASRWSNGGLTLGTSLLTASTLPSALCPMVCGWANAFACGTGLDTACPTQAANASCARCRYPLCPAGSNLADASFSAVAQSCATPSLTVACSTCLPSLVMSFSLLGVKSESGINGCIDEYVGALLVNGASPVALSLMLQCSDFLTSSSVTCPATLPSALLANVVSSCSSVSTVCSVCTPAVVAALVSMGTIPANLTLKQQFEMANSCSFSLFAALFDAGVPTSSFVAYYACPATDRAVTPFAVTASVFLAGTPTISFSSAAFKLGVAAALNVGAQAVILKEVIDIAARRRLLSVGCNVTFTVTPSSLQQQQTILQTLTSPQAGQALLSALLANGNLVASVAITLLSVVSGPSPPALAPGPARLSASRLSAGATAGVVAGSIVGAVLLAASAVFWVRRCIQSGGSFFGSSSQATSSDGDKSNIDGDTSWSTFVSTADEVQLGDKIGEGGSGSVFDARWRGSRVAAKVFHVGLHQGRPRSSADKTVAGSVVSGDWGSADVVSWPTLPTLTNRTTSLVAEPGFIKEVALLAQLRHPNILAMYAIVREPAMLIMELGPNGSLRSYLLRVAPDQLSWPSRVDILCGVAAGVEFLHSQQPPMVHLDLKADNIVLSGSLVPKIADLGLSVRVDDKLRASRLNVSRGTPAFMAPEVARQEAIQLYEAVDVYGFGCIALDVAQLEQSSGSGSPADPPTADVPALHAMLHRLRANFAVTVRPSVPAPLATLIHDCLAISPALRPGMTDVGQRLAAMGDAII